MNQPATTSTIGVANFRQAFLATWRELFEPVDGGHAILDSGTSFFETLADITPQEANIPISQQSASLAAQVQHTAFYIEALPHGLATNWSTPIDWDETWQLEPVDATSWQLLVDRLHTSYDWVTEFVEHTSNWNEEYIGVAFALIGHAAYHLGEIRQGIGVIRAQ